MNFRDETRTVLAGVYVLLVEPHDESRDVLTSVLEYCGASVLATASAKDAAARLRLITPHVVLSSPSPPDHDGRWLLAQIRASSDGHAPPAIALTTETEAPAPLADGFRAVMPKPIDPDALCDAIRRLVSPTP
jgi:CheY-like chemotaxis protein